MFTTFKECRFRPRVFARLTFSGPMFTHHMLTSPMFNRAFAGVFAVMLVVAPRLRNFPAIVCVILVCVTLVPFTVPPRRSIVPVVLVVFSLGAVARQR